MTQTLWVVLSVEAWSLLAFAGWVGRDGLKNGWFRISATAATVAPEKRTTTRTTPVPGQTETLPGPGVPAGVNGAGS